VVAGGDEFFAAVATWNRCTANPMQPAR
jgi:hypothetical protein